MGSGTVNGAINTSAGSGIYGGTDGTYGTNTFASNLTLATGAAAYFDLGTSATGSNDEIVVNGTLTLNGNAIHVKAPSPSALPGSGQLYACSAMPTRLQANHQPSLVWDVPPAERRQICTRGCRQQCDAAICGGRGAYHRLANQPARTRRIPTRAY